MLFTSTNACTVQFRNCVGIWSSCGWSTIRYGGGLLILEHETILAGTLYSIEIQYTVLNNICNFPDYVVRVLAYNLHCPKSMFNA
jgi:hypothetical protein